MRTLNNVAGRSTPELEIQFPMIGDGVLEDGRSAGESAVGARPLVASDDVLEVMRAYFATMERFLQVQQEVIATFLGGANAEQPMRPAQVNGVRRHITREKVAPPSRTESNPAAVPATTQSAAGSVAVGQAIASTGEPRTARATGPLTRREITAALLKLVSERTGYPMDVINPKLDLEADLGIDSIKRVEIIGAFQQATGLARASDMEMLAASKTLEDIIERLASRAGAGGSAPIA